MFERRSRDSAICNLSEPITNEDSGIKGKAGVYSENRSAGREKYVEGGG